MESDYMLIVDRYDNEIDTRPLEQLAQFVNEIESYWLHAEI